MNVSKNHIIYSIAAGSFIFFTSIASDATAEFRGGAHFNGGGAGFGVRFNGFDRGAVNIQDDSYNEDQVYYDNDQPQYIEDQSDEEFAPEGY